MADRKNTADTAGAMAALTSAINSMEKRATDLSKHLDGAKASRNASLDRRVAELLPDISDSTRLSLLLEEPAFATDGTIVRTFAQNGKFLGIFSTPKYKAALVMLRSQMKKYLESKGIVKKDDAFIQAMQKSLQELAAQQKDAMETLKLIERAHRLAAPLPSAATASINKIAQRGAKLGSATAGKRTSSSGDDSSDIWLWMMTDIPTSFRTLMLDLLSVHHSASTPSESRDGTYSGSGAQGAWSTDAKTTADQSSPSDGSRGAAAAGFVGGMAAADLSARDGSPDNPAPAGDAGSSVSWPAELDPAIATDDSLGKFS